MSASSLRTNRVASSSLARDTFKSFRCLRIPEEISNDLERCRSEQLSSELGPGRKDGAKEGMGVRASEVHTVTQNQIRRRHYDTVARGRSFAGRRDGDVI